MATPLLPHRVVVLRARQRREDRPFDDIERQFALDDLDVAPDRFRRVGRQAEDVARVGEDALRFPRQQHFAVFGDLVLRLFDRLEIVGIDILETDEHARHAGALALLDEVRDLVAERVDLDHQAERNLVDFAQLDQPIEDRLPLSVAGKIIVGEEEARNAFRPVLADDVLDVVGRARARFAALDIDDGAERTLIRAAAPGIETADWCRRCACTNSIGRNGLGCPVMSTRSSVKS